MCSLTLTKKTTRMISCFLTQTTDLLVSSFCVFSVGELQQFLFIPLLRISPYFDLAGSRLCCKAFCHTSLAIWNITFRNAKAPAAKAGALSIIQRKLLFPIKGSHSTVRSLSLISHFPIRHPFWKHSLSQTVQQLLNYSYLRPSYHPALP